MSSLYCQSLMVAADLTIPKETMNLKQRLGGYKTSSYLTMKGSRHAIDVYAYSLTVLDILI
jgi:hypothetical protein